MSGVTSPQTQLPAQSSRRNNIKCKQCRTDRKVCEDDPCCTHTVSIANGNFEICKRCKELGHTCGPRTKVLRVSRSTKNTRQNSSEAAALPSVDLKSTPSPSGPDHIEIGSSRFELTRISQRLCELYCLLLILFRLKCEQLQAGAEDVWNRQANSSRISLQDREYQRTLRSRFAAEYLEVAADLEAVNQDNDSETISNILLKLDLLQCQYDRLDTALMSKTQNLWLASWKKALLLPGGLPYRQHLLCTEHILEYIHPATFDMGEHQFSTSGLHAGDYLLAGSQIVSIIQRLLFNKSVRHDIEGLQALQRENDYWQHTITAACLAKWNGDHEIASALEANRPECHRRVDRSNLSYIPFNDEAQSTQFWVGSQNSGNSEACQTEQCSGSYEMVGWVDCANGISSPGMAYTPLDSTLQPITMYSGFGLNLNQYMSQADFSNTEGSTESMGYQGLNSPPTFPHSPFFGMVHGQDTSSRRSISCLVKTAEGISRASNQKHSPLSDADAYPGSWTLMREIDSSNPVARPSQTSEAC